MYLNFTNKMKLIYVKIEKNIKTSKMRFLPMYVIQEKEAGFYKIEINWGKSHVESTLQIF